MANSQPGIENTIDYSKPWNKQLLDQQNQLKPLEHPKRDVKPAKEVKSLRKTNQNKNPDDEQQIDQNNQENLLQNIDDKLKNQNDAIVEETSIEKDQKESLDKISNKLDVLSEKLSEKYVNEKGEKIKKKGTTSELLKDESPLSEGQSEEKTPAEKLFPEKKEEKVKSKELLDNKPDEGNKPGKELTSLKDNVMEKGFDKVSGLLKSGFKSTVSAYDKVANFLFKNSLKQAIEFGKMALALFALIVAIDVIRAYWAVWGDKVLAKMDEWATTLSGWWDAFVDWSTGFTETTANIFENMGANLMEIKNAWTSGDWPALTLAIGKGIVDFGKTILAGLVRAVATVLSSVLRAFGMDEKADRVEANGILAQQTLTDSKLTDDQQRKLAENQIIREKEHKEQENGKGVVAKSIGKAWDFVRGGPSAEESAAISDVESRSKLSHEDNVKSIMATNEAKAALARYKKVADAADPNNKDQMDKVDKYRDEAKEYLSKKELDFSPETKKLLESQFKSVTTKAKPVAKPASAANSDNNKIANSITANSQPKIGTQQPQQSTANIQNTFLNNSRSIHVQSPVTSTNAPGIFKSTGTN